MPLKIVKAADPIFVDRVVLTIYAPPGVGKTSLGFSADAPLLLDTDAGAYRSAFRQDAVLPKVWGDIAGITQQDVAPYKTLVMDTAGRALDLLAADIISQNPKMGRGGALTLQGYGELKSRFTAYLKLVRSFGLDVVLIAHSDEKQSGDELIERIDMQGSSKQEVYKSSDAMARLLIAEGRRVLSFSPTDTSFGKDPASFGRVSVPHLSESPRFLGELIQQLKDALNAESAAQKEAAGKAQARAVEWDGYLALCKEPEDFTRLVGEAKTKPEKKALIDAAEAKGFAFDKKAGEFTAPLAVVNVA